MLESDDVQDFLWKIESFSTLITEVAEEDSMPRYAEWGKKFSDLVVLAAEKAVVVHDQKRVANLESEDI